MVDRFFQQNKTKPIFSKKTKLVFFPDKVHMGRSGVGVGVRIRVRSVVFFAEKSVDHAKSHDTILPDYHTLS